MSITGPSGIGKTQIALRYESKYPGYTDIVDDGTKVKVMPVVYCKLPYPFTSLEFFQKLTRALGSRVLKPHESVGTAKTRVLGLLETQKVELLIIDELDFINRSNMPDVQGMEHLKDLSNAGVCLACLGTPNVSKFLDLDDQYKGRFERGSLPAFELDDAFYKLLQDIESQIAHPIHVGLGAPDNPYGELLYIWTLGRLRPLYKILHESYRLLGVFEPGFNDLPSAILTSTVLEAAKSKILGGDVSYANSYDNASADEEEQ